MKKKITVLTLLTLTFCLSIAQEKSITNQELFDKRQQFFQKNYVETNRDSNIYIGRKYEFNYPGAKGSPFVFSEKNFQGNIDYNYRKFYNQPFLYDIVQDELVVKKNNSDSSINYIVLTKNIVKKFDFDHYGTQRTFINSKYIFNQNVKLEPGYYELIYNKSNILLVKKYSTWIKESPMAGGNRVEIFPQTEMYYIDSEGEHTFKGFKVLKKRYPEQKKLINAYIKQNKIKFKNIDNAHLVTLLNICTQNPSNY